MKLQCNIDARGKLVRLIFGVALVVIGIALLVFWALPARTPTAADLPISAHPEPPDRPDSIESQ